MIVSPISTQVSVSVARHVCRLLFPNVTPGPECTVLVSRHQVIGIKGPSAVTQAQFEAHVPEAEIAAVEEAASVAAREAASADGNARADAFWHYWMAQVSPRIRDNYEPHRVIVNRKLRSGDPSELSSLPGYIGNIINVFPDGDPDHAGFEQVRTALLQSLL